jgi:hypothetical protein
MRNSHRSAAGYALASFLTGVLVLCLLAITSFQPSTVRAQADPTATPVPTGGLKEGLGTHVQLAPAGVSDTLPLIYSGYAPSDVQKELVGPVLLVKSGKVDLETATVTLPLYNGKLESGETVWYILLDTSDPANAQSLGINFSRKLIYADQGKAVREAHHDKGGTLIFKNGKVDFSPELKIEPGDKTKPFPPKSFNPGAIGDKDYSPLIRITNAGNAIYNAPTVAFDVDRATLDKFCDSDVDHKLVHDRAVRICPRDGTVTMKMSMGFSAGHPVFYTSTDTNVDLAAAMENATFAPAMSDITFERDDKAFSAVERLFAIVNGATGKDNPHRQGFYSAFLDGSAPLNILSSVPTVGIDYSPLWDVYPAQWTQKAIDLGYRARLMDEFSVLNFIQGGWLVGLNEPTVRAIGIIVDCPAIIRLY